MSDAEAFIAALPSDRLTAQEAALRQALLEIISLKVPFPLTEWLDRRVGGEIEVRRTELGEHELCLRGSWPEPANGKGGTPPETEQNHAAGRDAFFANLDPASFSAAEEQLRGAVFEFLARWRSKSLARPADLVSDERVQQKAKAFLPPGVDVREWVERRIGGEVEFHEGPQGEVVHLSAKARPYVTAKFQEISASESSSAPAAAAAATPGKGASKSAATQPPATAPFSQAKTTPPNKEVFFAGLPRSELTPAELGLRQALLEFLEAWPRSCQSLGKAPGSPSFLSDLAGDANVSRYRTFIPASVQLKDWIDRRIGGEIETRAEGNQVELRRRGASAPEKAPKRQPSPQGRSSNSCGGSSAGSGGHKARTAASERGSGGADEATIEEFMQKLPAERHTREEVDLRQAILSFLDNSETPAHLTEMLKEATVSACSEALLPRDIPVATWIDRRIGGEVETFRDEAGRLLLQIRGEAQAANSAGSQQQELKAFFNSLPPDGFTAEEEELRSCLLDLLSVSSEPPTLNQVQADAQVKRLRAKLLPRTCPATLRNWIDWRIGGEVELYEGDDRQVHMCLRGQSSRKRSHHGNGGGDRKRRAW